MRLVDDKHVPSNRTQERIVDGDHFVRRQKNVKFDARARSNAIQLLAARLRNAQALVLVKRHVEAAYDGARVLAARVRNDVHVGRPEFEFAFPIDDRR